MLHAYSTKYSQVVTQFWQGRYRVPEGRGPVGQSRYWVQAGLLISLDTVRKCEQLQHD